MEQLNLDFDAPVIPHGVMNRNDVYFATRPKHGSQAAKVLGWLREFGPATREEISIGMGLPVSSICGRINKLIETCDVVETELRRPTRNGKTAVVVRAAS